MDTNEPNPLGIDQADFDLAAALSLFDAAKLLRGRHGKPPHLDVVRRWANPRKGCVAGDGSRIVLPMVKLGGELLTMRAWVEAFQAARLRRRPVVCQQPPLDASARQRLASWRRADEQLRAAGI